MSFLSFIIFYCFNMCTNSSIDMLAKYSYPIFAVDGDTQHAGTAFFYRSHNQATFLVSNYHAIKGMSPMHNRQIFSPAKAFLKYSTALSNQTKMLELDISDKNTGKTQVFYMANDIDILKVPIDLPVDAKIYYINDLIDTSYFNKIPDSVYIFGYPNPQAIPTIFWSKLSKFVGKFSVNGFDNFYAATMRKYPLFTEKEAMYKLGELYFFVRPFIDKGYSGAPVIGRFKTANGDVMHKFIGVNFGNEPLSMQTWVIRGDIAYKYLSK